MSLMEPSISEFVLVRHDLPVRAPSDRPRERPRERTHFPEPSVVLARIYAQTESSARARTHRAIGRGGAPEVMPLPSIDRSAPIWSPGSQKD